MDHQPELEFFNSDEAEKELKIEEKRMEIRHSAVSGKFDTIQEKVAWVLNRYSETRNSDITLQLRYWQHFDSDLYNGHTISPNDLYRLTRLTSLQRARAKIQNTYKLFQATEEVKNRRGTLGDSEKKKAVEQKSDEEIYAVYADESGKNQKYLIVGSIWFLHGPEIGRLSLEIDKWKKRKSFDSELHFSKINQHRLPLYKEVADILATESSAISFKAVSVDREGISKVEDALKELYYLLLVSGVDHEHKTGRGSLPRQLQLQKDAEATGPDKLLLENLRDRMAQASSSRFSGQLQIGDFDAVDSSKLDLIQLADLFTGAVNRILNTENTDSNPKDEFSAYLLKALDMPNGPSEIRETNDMTYHVAL